MTNPLQKIGKSITGVLFGVVIFIASFFVLFYNEGRVDISKTAEKATEIEATLANQEFQDQLVVTTGDLTSAGNLGDDYLKTGDYAALKRNVEMYAWDEESKTKDDETTYTYKKLWTSNPSDSSKFNNQEGHVNPTLNYKSATFYASDGKIGVFDIDLDRVTLPNFDQVTLSDENVILGGRQLEAEEEFYDNIEDIPAELSNGYVFKGFGTAQSPEIGDIRVSFSSIQNGTELTIFGQLKDTSIKPFVGPKNTKLYRAFRVTKEEAIAQMHGEYKMWLWIMRFVGFLMMTFGIGLILGPITTLLDFIPLVGKLGKTAIGILSLLVAAILSAITILISVVLHNIWLLFGLIVIAGGIIGYLVYRAKNKPTETQKS